MSLEPVFVCACVCVSSYLGDSDSAVEANEDEDEEEEIDAKDGDMQHNNVCAPQQQQGNEKGELTQNW